MIKAAFLDRDGVINIDHAYVHRIEDFDFIEGVLEAAAKLVAAGYALVIVTNQSGIGRGYYTEKDFHRLDMEVRERFAQAKAPITAVYFCPHHPTKAQPGYLCDCNCRKPQPGMLLRAAKELDIDLAASVMFGDKTSDMRAALSAGVGRRVLLGTDGVALPDPVPECTECAQSLATALTGCASDLVSTNMQAQ